MKFICAHCGKESDERDLILLRPLCPCFKMKASDPDNSAEDYFRACERSEQHSKENDHGQEKAR